MDRLEEWRVFIAVATRRSFVAAARSLGRSPQAVTRAVAAVEARVGTRLLHRTTRAVSLTDDGERYVERGRRALAELDLLEAAPEAERPLGGRLSVTGSVQFGQLHLVPLVTEFLRRHPALDVRLLLVDRVVSLAEERVDLAIRIGDLPDSSLRARTVGQARSLVCASPAYLKRAGEPGTPEELAGHECVAFSGITPIADRWTFPAPASGRRERSVAVRARLAVNSAQAAIDAAVAGLGVVRVLSYMVARLVKQGRLRVLLARFEPEPLPVQVVYPPGVHPRAASAFLDFASERIPARLIQVS